MTEKAAKLAVAFLMISSITAVADEIPIAFEATYVLSSRGARIASMVRKLAPLSGNEFLYQSKTKTTGLVSLIRKDRIFEQSRWTLAADGPRPLHYTYEHTGGKKNRNVTILFDWNANQITNTINGSAWKMPADTNVMDKLLYQLAIMQDLQSGKTPISYTIADGGKIKNYRFELLGEESIATPIGNFHTIKLARHRPDSKRKTTLWCASRLHYLPVKVENIEKDGRRIVAMIQSLNGIQH